MHNMTTKAFHAPEISLALDFFKLRHVDDKELEQRVKRELAEAIKRDAPEGYELSDRTESEFGTLKSAQKRLWRLAWTAMRNWQPESLEKLARAMHRIQRHSFPDSHDAWRRVALIGNKGNVADAVKSIHWPCDPANEKRKLNRLKKVLFRRTLKRTHRLTVTRNIPTNGGKFRHEENFRVTKSSRAGCESLTPHPARSCQTLDR